MSPKDHVADGRKGGSVSPTNFKNDPKAASAAGKLSKPSPWPQCPGCGVKMSAAKLQEHLLRRGTLTHHPD